MLGNRGMSAWGLSAVRFQIQDNLRLRMMLMYAVQSWGLGESDLHANIVSHLLQQQHPAKHHPQAVPQPAACFQHFSQERSASRYRRANKARRSEYRVPCQPAKTPLPKSAGSDLRFRVSPPPPPPCFASLQKQLLHRETLHAAGCLPAGWQAGVIAVSHRWAGPEYAVTSLSPSVTTAAVRLPTRQKDVLVPDIYRGATSRPLISAAGRRAVTASQMRAAEAGCMQGDCDVGRDDDDDDDDDDDEAASHAGVPGTSLQRCLRAASDLQEPTERHDREASASWAFWLFLSTTPVIDNPSLP
ncbi:hypothetical protein AAFF_G00100900 [Aldrovandia affinis]|uniref:Uncharacterized protein n=1 Tax=Aldrovandia affinis TaxID=143900 RepID=A0AAD7RUY9_9TELE|nr:hypothetical protein AAFF_G00100900 [Aldrovandia affinis]